MVVADMIDLPDLEEAKGLQKIVVASLRARGGKMLPRVESGALWPMTHFGLDRVSVFQQATGEQQAQILGICAQGVLAESYHIEKCGMYFAAKMNLLSESTEERMLYSVFAADEATHLSWISAFVVKEAVESAREDSFIQQLQQVIQHENKAILAYVIQVVLEGWGIQHYRQLAKNCLNPILQATLIDIVKDEARHHASGLVLLQEDALQASLPRVTELMKYFFSAVQTGPLMVVSAVEKTLGHLSLTQKEKVFAELDCRRQIGDRTQILRELVQAAPWSGHILGALE